MKSHDIALLVLLPILSACDADVAVNAIDTLIYVEGGSFDMGDFKAPCSIPSNTPERMDWSPDNKCYSMYDDAGAYNLHKVTLDSYSIAKFETTYADMEVMRRANNLPVADYSKSASNRNSEKFKQRLEKMKKHAAFTKTWQEGKDYCVWLAQLTALPFDLPTEAQWEYAARSRGQYYYFATHNGYLQLRGGHYLGSDGRGVMYEKEDVNAPSMPDDVDAYPPNPLGVSGMSNQVSEWVNDWYDKDYYLHSPEHNPQGPKTGSEKVQRDGRGTTMTFSRLHSKGMAVYYVGSSFRCALQQTQPVLP